MYVCLQPTVLLCLDFQAPDMIRIRLTLTWGPLCVNDVSLESIGMVFVVTFNKKKKLGRKYGTRREIIRWYGYTAGITGAS